MRFTLPLGLAVLALILAFALVGTAFARESVRPDQPVSINAMRSIVDHYRALTWTYQRAADTRKTPASFRDRRSTDRAYLQWSIDTWTRRADLARRDALARIQRRLSIRLPKSPPLYARLLARVRYSRRLTLNLRRIYPGRVTRSFASATGTTGRETLRLWQQRSALAAVAVSKHSLDAAVIPAWLNDAFLCIHHYEGAWTANTGNGYYGGLQMDLGFQASYGADFLRRWGTADTWPVWAQLQAAARAYQSGRGFSPWPNTARACSLI
ncbi:MAG: Transglycosylase-like domain [Gaiellaceae bacterium]|nr:Transglycosylase-like domain [Gaiellaceae bacterium]